MEEKEIFVPLLPWLIGGSRIGGSYNTYSGSLGTDPETGCFNKKIFNYRIWIEKTEETEIIKSAVYQGMKCYEKQDEDAIERENFELNEEGRKELINWLEEKKNNFFSSED